jgi:lipoate-protein ligase B
MRKLWVTDLGLIGYSDCYALQRELVDLRSAGLVEDMLLLLEHTPVITMGTSGGKDALLVSPDGLARAGVELVKTNRGGNITYHGPGQLVCYPIIDLHNYDKDVHKFLRNLEEVVIRCIGNFGVTGIAVPGLTGVWVGTDKICSIGVAARRWISYHGLAVNVDPNLQHWSFLHPCGLVGRHVTSLKSLVEPCPSMSAVKECAAHKFVELFGYEPVQMPLPELMKYQRTRGGAGTSDAVTKAVDGI